MKTGSERQREYRQRKMAAGYRIIHGRLTLEPLQVRRGVPPPHGTTARYTSKTHTCRCTDCLTARREYIRAWKAAR